MKIMQIKSLLSKYPHTSEVHALQFFYDSLPFNVRLNPFHELTEKEWYYLLKTLLEKAPYPPIWIREIFSEILNIPAYQSNLAGVISILSDIHEKDSLDLATFRTILRTKNRENFILALRVLSKVGLYSKKNIECLVNYSEQEAIVPLIGVMHHLNVWNDYHHLLSEIPDLSVLNNALNFIAGYVPNDQIASLIAKIKKSSNVLKTLMQLHLVCEKLEVDTLSDAVYLFLADSKTELDKEKFEHAALSAVLLNYFDEPLGNIKSQILDPMEELDLIRPSFLADFSYRSSLTIREYVYLLLSNDSKKVLSWLKQVPEFLNIFPIPAMIKLINLAADQPELAKALQSATKLRQISFFDGGRSTSSSWRVADGLLNKAIPPKLKPSQTKEQINSVEINRQHYQQLTELTNNQWKFFRLQGRTILFQNEHKDVFAIKIKRTDESLATLEAEYKTINHLASSNTELNLKSKLPTPNEICEIENLSDDLQKILSPEDYQALISLIGSNKQYTAYSYTIKSENKGYLTYLHDPTLSKEDYQKANEAIVYDLCQLLVQKGMVNHQLCDIFHTRRDVDQREDSGRYLVLADLLSPAALNNPDNRPGSGRLNAWERSADFPNVRASGLADFGDWLPLNDFMQQSDFIKMFLSPALNTYGESLGNYTISNILAEYQYVLMLNAGKRGKALAQNERDEGASDQETFYIWKELAEQLITNCALMASILTHQPIHEVRFFLSSMIDSQMLARQMQFWMTDEYVSYMNNEQIPSGVYEADTRIFLDKTLIRPASYSETLGCVQNGVDQDLGFVNGQEPIKKFNELLYWMDSYVLSKYHERVLVKKECRAILKETNPTTRIEKLKNPYTLSYLQSKERYQYLYELFPNDQANKNSHQEKRKPNLQGGEEQKFDRQFLKESAAREKIKQELRIWKASRAVNKDKVSSGLQNNNQKTM